MLTNLKNGISKRELGHFESIYEESENELFAFIILMKIQVLNNFLHFWHQGALALNKLLSLG